MPLRDEQYILSPCAGRSRLGIPSGHLYKVMDRGRNELGFATEDTARTKYGEENYFVGDSHTICPLCNADLNGELGIDVRLIRIDK